MEEINKNRVMKCGHKAIACVIKDGKKIYCCPICRGEDAFTPINKPNTTGRQAKCIYCGRTCKSSYELAFFQHKPQKQFDEYYCGCEGWD